MEAETWRMLVALTELLVVMLVALGGAAGVYACASDVFA